MAHLETLKEDKRTLKLVLTGVNGFIGNQILEASLKLNSSDLLNRSAGNADEIEFPKFLHVYGSDLENTSTRFTAKRFAGSARLTVLGHLELLEALESKNLTPDAIVHNGACSSTTETDPEIFRTLNLEYSKRLWKVCCDLKIPFIYASSASVYGNGEHGFDDDPRLLENLKAMNLYARSKLDFDIFAQNAPIEPSLWFGLRYFNVYGPFENHKGAQASMVFHSFNQIMKTGEVSLFKGTQGGFGDGLQMRDFLYVKDIISLTVDLLKQMLNPHLQQELHKKLKTFTQRSGCFLNVGTGTARTWNDLVHCVFQATGKKPVVKYVEMPEKLRKQYQDFTEAKHTAGSLLGLSTDWTPLESGVQEYVTKILIRNIGY